MTKSYLTIRQLVRTFSSQDKNLCFILLIVFDFLMRQFETNTYGGNTRLSTFPRLFSVFLCVITCVLNEALFICFKESIFIYQVNNIRSQISIVACRLEKLASFSQNGILMSRPIFPQVKRCPKKSWHNDEWPPAANAFFVLHLN